MLNRVRMGPMGSIHGSESVPAILLRWCQVYVA